MVGLPKSIIKKYGITKKAWEIFRGHKSLKRSSPKSKVTAMAKTRKRVGRAKKRYTRRARGLMGGLGKGLSFKSLAAGTLGLILTDRYQPFGGVYKPAVDKIAIGIVGPMMGLDNQDMLTVGIKEGLARVVGGYLGGVAAPTNGSNYL